MWGVRNPCTLLWECKQVQPFWKKIWRFHKNLNRSAIWSSNPTPGDIPKGMWHRLLQRHLHILLYCSTIHNSQVIETPRSPLLKNGLRKCGIYTQWNSTQPWRRMKSYHSQVNGWNWRTSFWARLARLRKPKIVCSPLYVDFRSRANAAMCWTWATWHGESTYGRYGDR
jgi:hypothetical protein